MSQTAPYGKWESTITPESIVQGSISFADLFVDPTNNKIYHTEARPEDNARYVIVDTLAGQDVIPSPYSARTGVQEYGGAAAMAYGGTLYFSNSTDNRVYSVNATTKTPEPVTPENPKYRYANFAVHPVRHDLIVSILEDHTVDTPQTVVTTLAVINTTRKAVFPLVVGADFYAAPVFNPSGTRIAWQEWYHPDMPWEGSLINVADVLVQEDTIVVLSKTRVAGELLTKSVNYPAWTSDTTLVFTSDELNGFQNPFIYSTLTNSARLAIPGSIEEDFGGPAWYLGDTPYALLDDPRGGNGKLAAFTAFRDGRNVLYIVSLSDDKYIVEIKEFPFSIVNRVKQSGGMSIVFSASKTDAPGGVFLCTFSGASFAPSYQVLKPGAPQSVSGNDAYISPPRPITLFRDEKPLYVVYYSPKNPGYSGSSIPGEKPPCIVSVHGGPTGMTPQVLSWERLYYTSRGYGWLDVNYGGSSGYGREYISRLANNWGIVDVQDCQDAPKLLAAAPYSLIDSQRVAIRGGSAGGFTTLASVSIAPDPGFFRAATSSFGISDLVSLAEFTHKFELRYMEKLLGGTPQVVPEVYAARSPLNHADRIVTPLLVLQGAEDKIVLPEQAEKIVNTIIELGGADRVKYHLFQGEGHGWRLAESIKEAVRLEHDWYDKKLL
ncbi:Alpha/Beta hydrolase protein [Butyriboletus roseoflavus]|nr:Alpha/Beta hydrolase protein [Butyriboletus roseoflavus]